MEGSYYLTLGIRRNESAAGIRHAFREQVKRYHPERVGPARADFFYAIIQAYRTLSHPERRRDYDRGLSPIMSDAKQPIPSSAAGGPVGLPQVSLALRSFQVTDVFSEAVRARISRNLTLAKLDDRAFPQALNIDVILSPPEALKGGMLDIAVPSCTPCVRCGGAGRQGLFPCDLCDGEGLREEDENLRVPVPPNVSDGARITVPLRGLGLHNFYLCVRIRVH